MRNLYGVLAGALLMAAVPALAHAGQEAKPKAPSMKAESTKELTATGVVTAVTATSLTVKGKAEWTFFIDKATEVTKKGATTKTNEMKAEGKSTVVTDFVKTGDSVTVTYHDLGATKHAAKIRATGPPTK